MENSYLIPLGLPADITLNVMGMNFKKKNTVCAFQCVVQSHITQQVCLPYMMLPFPFLVIMM